MPRRCPILMVLLALTMLMSALPAYAQSADDPYSIIRPEPGEEHAPPEPWLPPKYRSPRGSKQHITPPRLVRPEPLAPMAKVPPPILVPETGRVLPNLPTPSPSGPNGTETFQDRAARCAHQAGVYGEAAGNRSSYIGSCVNQ